MPTRLDNFIASVITIALMWGLVAAFGKYVAAGILLAGMIIGFSLFRWIKGYWP